MAIVGRRLTKVKPVGQGSGEPGSSQLVKWAEVRTGSPKADQRGRAKGMGDPSLLAIPLNPGPPKTPLNRVTDVMASSHTWSAGTSGFSAGTDVAAGSGSLLGISLGLIFVVGIS